MQVALKQIYGPWHSGWVLDKHTVRSTYLGDNSEGHALFETVRTEVGQASFLLKYRSDWSQVIPLAQEVSRHVWPACGLIQAIVPMPASRRRDRQPVTELARALGQLRGVPVLEQLLTKRPDSPTIKDISDPDAKRAALADSLQVNASTLPGSSTSLLLLDDLIDSGATMAAACTALRRCDRIGTIAVAALTWK